MDSIWPRQLDNLLDNLLDVPLDVMFRSIAGGVLWLDGLSRSSAL